MGYRQHARFTRNSGRGRSVPRHEKAKAKKQKRRISGSKFLDENPAVSSKEVIGKTLSNLHNLGKQVFGLYPFGEHYARWLMNLRVVLSELESNPAISLDAEFLKERSRILSEVELKLDEGKRTEAVTEEARKRLSERRALMERIEEEYTGRTREIKARRNDDETRLSGSVQSLKKEVASISEMKTGIFRGLSKKSKAKKLEEATKRLSKAEEDLELANQRFAVQSEELKAQFEKKKQPLISQLQEEQKKIEEGEMDASLEARVAACEALINAVNGVVGRNGGFSDRV